jgi:hypothetical protein
MTNTTTQKYVHEMKCGSGSIISEISFLPPRTALELPNDVNPLEFLLFTMDHGLTREHDVKLTYNKHWMGMDPIERVFNGIYLRNNNDHGFIFLTDEKRIIGSSECIFTSVHKTLNTIGVSEFMVMANGAESSDFKPTDRMLIVLGFDELELINKPLRYVREVEEKVEEEEVEEEVEEEQRDVEEEEESEDEEEKKQREFDISNREYWDRIARGEEVSDDEVEEESEEEVEK